MSVHVGYTVTDSTVPHGGSGTPTVRLTQSYTPTKPLQIRLQSHAHTGRLDMIPCQNCGEDRASHFIGNSHGRFPCRQEADIVDLITGRARSFYVWASTNFEVSQ